MIWVTLIFQNIHPYMTSMSRNLIQDPISLFTRKMFDIFMMYGYMKNIHI